jgi:Flp pilus assembly protein TadD
VTDLAARMLALQAGRDGHVGRADADLDRAMALDPGLAAAALRRPALYLDTFEDAYRKAEKHRGNLDARDQEILAAIKPAGGTTEQNLTEAARRLSALVERYPDDVEMRVLLAAAFGELGDPRSTPAYRAAVEIDPEFATVQGYLGSASAYDGDTEGARAAFDACRRVSPLSDRCASLAVALDGQEGRCEDAER